MKNLRKILVNLLLLVGLSACSNTPAGRTNNAVNNRKVQNVTLDYTGEVVVEIGQSIQVTPTITFVDNEIVDADTSWQSSRPKVASVSSEGVVTALSGGSSMISFIAGYKMAHFTVTIYSDIGGGDDPDVGVTTKIELNTYSRSLLVGGSFQLSATLINPTGLDETITYASEDAAVATVSETGLVSAVAVGTTNIVVSAIGKTAKCEIIVNEQGGGTDPIDEEEDYDFTVYFFIDYNNIDENDTTGTKLLAKFGWYHNEPIGNAGPDKLPANPTTPLDPAFPYFIGWSTHTIIDTKDDLCDLSTYVVENAHFLFLYGIWSDVPAGSFVL